MYKRQIFFSFVFDLYSGKSIRVLVMFCGFRDAVQEELIRWITEVTKNHIMHLFIHDLLIELFWSLSPKQISTHSYSSQMAPICYSLRLLGIVFRKRLVVILYMTNDQVGCIQSNSEHSLFVLHVVLFWFGLCTRTELCQRKVVIGFIGHGATDVDS